jgi:hypothetical protein
MKTYDVTSVVLMNVIRMKIKAPFYNIGPEAFLLNFCAANALKLFPNSLNK